MKKLILFGLLFFAVIDLVAQINYIEIEYTFTVKRPEGLISTFFKILKDNGKASIYYTKDTPTLGSGMVIPINKAKNFGVFTNKVTNRLYQYEPIFNKDFYILDDSITQKFTWKISSTSKKEILGYSCKMATCEFRGRKYTAFFSEDLPFNSGPWKLTGLPGTILEASTNDGMYKFESYKVSINLKPENIKNPYENKKIEFLAFVVHKKLFLKKMSDYQRKVQSEEKDEDVEYKIEDNSIELLNQN
jgi:GLPGLI family protein